MSLSTKEIISAYIKQKYPEKDFDKRMTEYYRPEVVEYEEKLGKQIFDMTADELEDMFLSFRVRHAKSNIDRPMSVSSLETKVAQYRVMFDWVIVNGMWKLMPNVLRAEQFKRISSKVKSEERVLTKDRLLEICSTLRSNLEEEQANFTELLFWMFYSGFFTSSEIIHLKLGDVDLKNGIASVGTRTQRLCDECIDALRKNQKAIEYKSHWTLIMIPYHGSFIKFPCRLRGSSSDKASWDNTYDRFQEQREESIDIMIRSRVFQARKITNEFFNYFDIYLLGFHDYIVSKCGENRFREILTSNRVREDVDEFDRYMREYNIQIADRDALKVNLRKYL